MSPSTIVVGGKTMDRVESKTTLVAVERLEEVRKLTKSVRKQVLLINERKFCCLTKSPFVYQSHLFSLTPSEI